MNQRDELASLVYAHGLNGPPNSVADAILAAGYSRPRVVETETESGALEALWTMPVGATIECGSGMLWRKVSTGMYGWVGTGVSHHCQPEVFMRDTPLTVLHLPEEKP